MASTVVKPVGRAPFAARFGMRLVVIAYLFLLVAWPVSLVAVNTFDGGPGALREYDAVGNGR